MVSTLKAILRVEASGAGTLSATHVVNAEAYQRIEVTVPAAAGGNDGSVTVDVQPGAGALLRLVSITASAYPVALDGSARLTYTVDGGADAIALDAPLLVVGGAIGTLLGDVQQVEFTNAAAESVDVVILVGRDATP